MFKKIQKKIDICTGKTLWGRGEEEEVQGASLKPEESEGCSPVTGSGGKRIRFCSSWPSDHPPTSLRSSVDMPDGTVGPARYRQETLKLNPNP